MDDTLLHTALHIAGNVATHVKPEDMGKPTPCSTWDVQALLNHMLNEVAWVPPLLEGKTIDEVGSSLDGDLVKGDPVGSWHTYAEAALKTAKTTPPEAITYLSYARKPAKLYVDEVGVDLIVHGWDLAQAIGAEFMIDDETVKAASEAVKEMLPMSREAGLIGPEEVVAGDAKPLDVLLAAYGRKQAWTA